MVAAFVLSSAGSLSVKPDCQGVMQTAKERSSLCFC